MNGPLFWPVYLVPTLLAWYRRRTGKPIVGSLGMIFLMNLFLGWTVIVWILMLANALGFNPVAWVVLRLRNVLPSGSSGMPQPTSTANQSSSARGPCPSCHGARQVTCPMNQGRGSWYDPPQGDQGVAQLRTCGTCMGSGKVTCMTCGGTGLAAALL